MRGLRTSFSKRSATAFSKRSATAGRYAFVLVREFRWTLGALAGLIVAGGLLYHLTPPHPSLFLSFYGAWMAMFAQSPFSPPATWYLGAMTGVYPLLGVVLIGEGVVRLGMLMVSRRRGEKEWMRVMASTYRDHVVVCGLGHLGYRVLSRLLAQGTPVVGIDKDESGQFIAPAKAAGAAILIRDMRDDDALLEAGVPRARAIILATENDLANLEVALDARRLRPGIRVAMRMFDQKMASKVQDAFQIDYAFSSSALAAPAVAAMSLDCRVVAAFDLAGVFHVTAEVSVGAAHAGQTVAALEEAHRARVLCRTPRGAAAELSPSPTAVLGEGDTLLVHAPADEIPSSRST